MGSTLSSPVTTKETSSGEDLRFAYGASSMQGWRTEMEDAHTTLLNVEGADGVAFFGVYDGHLGDQVSKICSETLHRSIVDNPAFSAGDYEKAIVEGFMDLDRTLEKDDKLFQTGSTAVTATITKQNTIYVGNAGDSRAIICRKGTALDLSNDHKPYKEEETKRIESAGGKVVEKRVNGMLALSRALGDFMYKANADLPPEQQMVIAKPEVKVHIITADDEFMVLACDGIWDCLTSQNVSDYIRERIIEGSPLDEICEKMMDRLLAKKGKRPPAGYDNMTIVIVAFLNGGSVDEWRDRIRNNAQSQEAGQTDGQL